MKGIYSRKRHLRGVRKFRKCNGLSERTWEEDKGKRDKKSIYKERKKEKLLNPETKVFKRSE